MGFSAQIRYFLLLLRSRSWRVKAVRTAVDPIFSCPTGKLYPKCHNKSDLNPKPAKFKQTFECWTDVFDELTVFCGCQQDKSELSAIKMGQILHILNIP